MRVSGSNSIEMTTVHTVAASSSVDKADWQESTVIVNDSGYLQESQSTLDQSEAIKEKLQQAVAAMNEFLEVNHSATKFMYHEGLERYYVTVINKKTEEVVKEIPPRKILDAFYEMQKMLGMIVDEKI